MNQSAIIGGSLVAGFVLWIAKQDRLSTYARVFFGAKPASHDAAAPNVLGQALSPATPFGIGQDFKIPTMGDVMKELPQLPNILVGLPGLPNTGWDVFGSSSGTNG